MASTKRDTLATETTDGAEKKKTKLMFEANTSCSQPSDLVVLNLADCALDFDIEGGGLQGSALCGQGFSYIWSGARANVGITAGKYFFGCKIIKNQEVIMEDTPPDQQNLCRIGISRGDNDIGNLGETQHSFGYGGTGKFSNSGNFLNYGEKFGEGDTIVCAVDLESKPSSISFFKNEKFLGYARHFDASSYGIGVMNNSGRKLSWGSALFPHILLKNVMVKMEFTPENGLVSEGYKPWSSALEDGNGVFGPTFSDPSECEVMMMVGLPASGKSTWAEKRVKEHPDKHYVLLGTNKNLEQMKVPGLMRKHNYAERFEKLMGHATQILNELLPRAAKVPRNYIIDQTNVYKGARKRKLIPFADYRKVAVVVFPRPEELKVRSDKRFRQMEKEVPAEAVEEMLRNYVLPMSKDMLGTDEFFDEIIFTELNREEARMSLDQMKYAQLSANYVSSASVSPYQPPPSLNFIYQMPADQVNSGYVGSISQTEMGSFSAANQTRYLASAQNAYNYSLNNSNPYGVGYNISHDAYGSYQSPMVGLSMYPPPPPVSYGSLTYATTLVSAPTYGIVPVIPQPSNTGGFYPSVQGSYGTVTEIPLPNNNM